MIRKLSPAATATLLTVGLAGLLDLTAQAAPYAGHPRLSTAVFTTHRLKPPPDSYLQYRVYTVDQLIQQVQANPVVRQRFARHFQIPEDRVVSYMRANLVESYIPVTRHYTVYCISRTGRIYALKQTFRKGTKVFALRNGQPVLKWLCGNPLSRFLPAVVTQTFVTKPKPRVIVSRSIQTLTENSDVLVPNELAAPAFLPSVPLAFGGSAPSVLGGLGGGFPAALLLPAAFLFSNNGQGGGGNVPPHIPPPVAIPEPASPVLLGLGLPLTALVVLRRRRAVEHKSG